MRPTSWPVKLIFVLGLFLGKFHLRAQESCGVVIKTLVDKNERWFCFYCGWWIFMKGHIINLSKLCAKISKKCTSKLYFYLQVALENVQEVALFACNKLLFWFNALHSRSFPSSHKSVVYAESNNEITTYFINLINPGVTWGSSIPIYCKNLEFVLRKWCNQYVKPFVRKIMS